MTRGQIAIITKDYEKVKIITSTEFNGDMYLEGHGEEAIRSLEGVKDVAKYFFAVAKFNLDNHHYNDINGLTYEKDESTLDFTKDYFKDWFSDYVYIKNITKEPVTINTFDRNKNGDDIGTKKFTLQPNTIAVLLFGRLIMTKLTEEY